MSYSHGFTQALYLMLYVGDKIEQGMYEFIPTQKISEDLNIPPSSAASILSRLNRAGLIETREGAGGGVRLAALPTTITVLDILEAIEQGRPLFQLGHKLNVAGSKPSQANLAIGGVLSGAEETMKQYLGNVTLKHLMVKINP